MELPATLECECGYQPVMYYDYPIYLHMKNRYKSIKISPALICLNCGELVVAETEAEAVEGWNAIRAQQDE